MKKLLKYIIIFLIVIIIIPIGTISVLYISADTNEPNITIDTTKYKVTNYGSYKQCNSSILRQSSSGLWELYLNGDAQTRGADMGALTKDLMRYQEDVFITQIKNIIPSNSYLKFLRTITMVFNRNLGKHITEEYRTEIYASSLFCTHEYDAIGTPYERQLNYHAAHDIGHTMQQYMLVGCSSFAAWGSTNTLDSTLVVGRNFDFYVGEDFARNKLITFCTPNKGYKYASIGWAGMIGVLSGMNETGLTVTINAAKGAIPTSAATPISLLAREILQYASTIEQAYSIASKRETFVSESILISSAQDGCAAIIEKTPHKMSLYKPDGKILLCTNHYQSPLFADDKYNNENIADSDSPYRFKRLGQLINLNTPLCEQSAVKILRDQRGLDGKDIGLANEMTINQSIAHHSVVFKPNQLKMWVSTSHWQGGKFTCYDLKKIFGTTDFSKETSDSSLTIAADSSYINNDYTTVVNYRKWVTQIKQVILESKTLSDNFIKEFEQINPGNYYTYKIIADYYLKTGAKLQAKSYYLKTLQREIPYNSERREIEKIIKEL